MKKLIITFILLTTIIANTFAQGYDVVEAGEEYDTNVNEVYLSAGIPSLATAFAVMFIAIFSAGQADLSEDTMPFGLTAGYNRYLCNEHLGLGGMVTYGGFINGNLLSAQAKITGQYGWEHFKIYHSASVGGGISINSEEVKPTFAFDFTLIGLKLDFKDFNIFTELSGPITGILKIGASYKF